jgi:membrane-bound lytic murein transglycosylase B
MAKGRRHALDGGWRQVAPLVPLALFASAFAVSATDDPAVANAASDRGAQVARNDPVVVPKETISAPVNIPVPGAVGNGVRRGEEPTQIVSGLSRNGIPEAALKAYSRAQQVMSQADPGCQLPWTLVAAIGRVESNHGRHGGNTLNNDGVATPGVRGPRLDGVRTARINDTDAGRYDGDTAFDRAVGPMQFIPGTWRAMGVDGDGDGIRNPQDIDDAAMSAAVYLCSGDTNLSRAGELNRALLRYNHSQPYVDLVVSIAKAYEGGSWIAVDNGTESNDQGIDRGTGKPGNPDLDAPADDDLPQAGIRPHQPGQKARPGRPQPRATPGGANPGDRPSTTPGTPTKPGQPTGEPTTGPPTRPPTVPPAGATVIHTTAGTIVGTVGSTIAELTRAAQYCESELAKVTITNPTQQQLQQCVTAFQTGGTTAADQVIRNLLSLLGLLGVLGGGILGS